MFCVQWQRIFLNYCKWNWFRNLIVLCWQCLYFMIYIVSSVFDEFYFWVVYYCVETDLNTSGNKGNFHIAFGSKVSAPASETSRRSSRQVLQEGSRSSLHFVSVNLLFSLLYWDFKSATLCHDWCSVFSSRLLTNHRKMFTLFKGDKWRIWVFFLFSLSFFFSIFSLYSFVCGVIDGKY